MHFADYSRSYRCCVVLCCALYNRVDWSCCCRDRTKDSETPGVQTMVKPVKIEVDNVVDRRCDELCTPQRGGFDTSREGWRCRSKFLLDACIVLYEVW